MEAVEKKPVKITENTLNPVSLIVILLGGVVWLTIMYAQGNANAKAIEQLSQRQDEYTKTVLTIDTRLSHIEGALGVKDK